MKTILAFNDYEIHIIDRMKKSLDSWGYHDELAVIGDNEIAIRNLAESISLYPSILGHQHLGRTTRSVDTLVQNLCVRDIIDILLNIPTKAILGKSFIIAKINFFLMQKYITRELPELQDITIPIHEIIENNVFLIMAEEVFLAIIADKNINISIRTSASYLLVVIWENRVCRGLDDFAPVLQNIWKTRERMIPSFGTLMGISELFSMAHNESGRVWLDFLSRDDVTQDEMDALLEFLMGLSFEEQNRIVQAMERTGAHSLSVNLINDLLGETRSYPDYVTDDPREIFKSFRHRKNNAMFRTRARRAGPKKTLEEYLMCYLLSMAGSETGMF